MAPEIVKAPSNDPISVGDLTIAPGVRETASEDGAVLLDIEQGVCFSLNPVGLKIWRLLKKAYSVDQIADTLEQEFHLPREQLFADTLEFVQSLEARRLIRRPGMRVAKQSWHAKIWPWSRHHTTAH